MKLTFCLPEISSVPTGGYKIIFEYANYLTDRGHEVSIVFLTHTVLSQVTKNKKIKSIVGKIRGKNQPSWFQLNPKIKKIMTPYLDGKDFPDADFVFATAVTTAECIKSLPSRCGKKCYFIQDFETWLLPEDKVIETFDYGFINFTVSEWLSDIVKLHTSNEVICLPNPINTEIFRVVNPIENRSSFVLGMLYHEGEHKGISYALDAIEIVKQKYPDIIVNIFGVPERPKFLSPCFNYVRKATQNDLVKLYNETAIFVCATVEEGFGLTGAESMACGCALVSTAYRGVHEYAEHELNALLSPVRDSRKLAENIMILIENETKRFSLAHKGSKTIAMRTWESVLEQLEGELTKNLCISLRK